MMRFTGHCKKYVTCLFLCDTYRSKHIQFKFWNVFSTGGEEALTLKTLLFSILAPLNNDDIF